MSLDDELRRRLQAAADNAGAGANPAAVTDAVATKAAAGGRPPLRLIGGLGVAGVIVGGVIGFTALKPAESAGASEVIVQTQRYSLFDCPDGGLRGTALPGDRVFVTGRNEAGDWLELRDPRNQSNRAWVPAGAVDPDAVADVPVVPCNPAVAMVTGAATSTSTSTTTSTTVPETTTTTTTTTTTPATATTIAATTVPGTTPVTTKPTVAVTVPPTTPPTVPPTVPPNQPPTVGTVIASPTTINGLSECGISTSTISVVVTDASGVASVRLDWSIPALKSPRTGSLLLTPSGNTFSGAISPGNGDNQDRYVALTITAIDAQGLTTVKQANKTLFVEYCLF